MAPSSSPSAMLVAASFARQYYYFLKKDPSQLYKLYSEQSLFSRADEADALDAFSSASGTAAIHEAIMASAGAQSVSKVDIASLKAQESQDGVIALITGSISFVGEDCKRFAQTLFLKRKRDGSYVAINDMVKYDEVFQAREAVEPAWEPPQKEPVVVPEQPPPSPPVVPPVVASPVVAPAPVQEVVPEPEVVADDAVDESTAAAVSAALEEEQPTKSWASMATRLKQGGGMLGPSKVQGFSMPAGLPPAGTNTRAQAAAKATTAPAAAAEGKKEEAPAPAPAAGSTSTHVRLWVSRLPADRSYGGKEVIDCLNQLLIGEGLPSGKVTDARMKDGSDWGSVMAANQEVADMIVQFSKDRKIVVQGGSLKLELDKGQNPTSKGSGGKGRGKGGKGEKGEKDNNGGKGGGRKGKGSSKGNQDGSAE